MVDDENIKSELEGDVETDLTNDYIFDDYEFYHKIHKKAKSRKRKAPNLDKTILCINCKVSGKSDGGALTMRGTL